MSKSSIIIGGGIACLATRCYARMNRYDSHISKTLPELDSIYMAGQWVQTGQDCPAG